MKTYNTVKLTMGGVLYRIVKYSNSFSCAIKWIE